MCPQYTFENTETGEEITLTMFISEYEEYKKENPHMKQIIAPSLISYRGGFNNASLPGDWKNILTKMKRAYPGSKINDGI